MKNLKTYIQVVSVAFSAVFLDCEKREVLSLPRNAQMRETNWFLKARLKATPLPSFNWYCVSCLNGVWRKWELKVDSQKFEKKISFKTVTCIWNPKERTFQVKQMGTQWHSPWGFVSPLTRLLYLQLKSRQNLQYQNTPELFSLGQAVWKYTLHKAKYRRRFRNSRF